MSKKNYNPLDPDQRLVEEHVTAIKHDRSLRVRNYAQSILFVLLGIAALLFSSRVSAEELAYMPNQAGGEIMLTTDKLPSCAGNMLVWSRAPGGHVITGCWFAEGHYVTIKWSGTGNLRVFRIADFNVRYAAMLSARPEVK